ncbi:BA14K family protein [Sinorhizobium medicae]|uniref:BA14K family protein n=1 Tax=Sinorhizobium medicae TaxID=110321 RepID=UPI000FD84EC2|nr:BA14K family protein [Sinorhizobium medicae]RVJ83868.1 BA14K family protein [Sinorhizobium medicae]
MTKFRSFVVTCALAAASAVPPVTSVQAMPRPALDIAIKAPAGVENATHRGRYGWRGGYSRRGYYGGSGFYPGWSPYYRRSGISFYFGPSYRYRPYYGNRYYYGQRHYGPGYYNYPYANPGYYGYRSYAPRHYGGGYVQSGGSTHVSWCLSRYRSYNPATNRYLTYGGVYRVCYSPYR